MELSIKSDKYSFINSIRVVRHMV